LDWFPLEHGTKKSYKIFFAIPFDSYSISMYREHIIPRLREKYGEEKELLCIVGNQQVGSPETYEAIETFKKSLGSDLNIDI
jgi:hypothetical protein